MRAPRTAAALGVQALQQLAVLAAVTLGLVACGGGSKPNGDAQAPTVSITAPAPFADALTGTVAVRADAGDNVGVTGVAFEVDGMPLGAPDALAPYEAVLDTSQLPAGQHVLRARAQDAAGNVSGWSSVTVRVGGGASLPAGFVKDEAWVDGLTDATAFAQAPDGRFFIAEQGGRLRVARNGALRAEPFHQVSVAAGTERGLIGVALHPDFSRNGVVYLHYTTPQGGAHNRISFVVANPARGGDVSTGVERVLVDLPLLSSQPIHNGGALHFGIDGKLYAGIGDNNNGAHSQDPSSPLGKLLRLNDDGTIPPDNPFAASRSDFFGRAVWASGLRNPFTFAVQPGTGRIHINDVGHDLWEEINVGAPGANFGWPGSEGFDDVGAGVTEPLFVYGHRPATPPGSGRGRFFTGFAIAGGTFYPQNGNFPTALRGNYFFADFGSRFIARLDLANDNAVYTFASVARSPVDLLVGNDGALYVLTREALARIGVP